MGDWTVTPFGQERGDIVLRSEDSLWALYRRGADGRLAFSSFGRYATEASAKVAADQAQE